MRDPPQLSAARTGSREPSGGTLWEARKIAHLQKVKTTVKPMTCAAGFPIKKQTPSRVGSGA